LYPNSYTVLLTREIAVFSYAIKWLIDKVQAKILMEQLRRKRKLIILQRRD